MFKTLWDKLKSLVSSASHAIEVAFSKEEQEILALLKPILGAAEAVALQDLVNVIRGVLTSGQTAASLDAWETLVLQALEELGGEIETLAKGLGSNVLQALIGLILATLPKAV